MKNLSLDEAKKRLGILQEFKEFAMRGNVVDLAIGVVIGGAFGKIVTSLVTDIITPVMGFVTPGGSDLKNKFLSLEPAKTENLHSLAEAQKVASVIAYGQFFSSIVDFLIVAFSIFMVVKLINKLNRSSILAKAEPTPQEKLLAEIRDLLKARP
jgi:large conductance mechanosensitive channel